MGSALLNTADDLELAASEEDLSAVAAVPVELGSRSSAASGVSDALRTQVAERLAAHRSRRGARQAQAAMAPARPAAAGRSAQIAAAVAERYARTPSYREVLAAEAERAIQQARAAAEVAALNAQAIAAAQQRLLEAYDEDASREAARVDASLAQARRGVQVDDLAGRSVERTQDTVREQELWPGFHEEAGRLESAPTNKTARRAAMRGAAANHGAESTAVEAATATAAAGLTVRLYEQDADRGGVLPGQGKGTAAGERLREERGSYSARGYREQHRIDGRDRSDDETKALDEEIAFRHAPVFEEPAGPPVALPANLIEFPRQLVAARKARPRYAEGPLRDEIEAAPGDGQLRIFEVDPAQISIRPTEAETQTAQWTSLWLDAPVREAAAKEAAATDAVEDEPFVRTAPALEPASLARRAAAGAINLAIVLCGQMVFTAVALGVAGHGAAGHAAGALTLHTLRTELMQTGLQGRALATVGAVSSLSLLLLFHGLFFWFSTATPGMRAVRIALCTFEDENPTRSDVRRRGMATMLSGCSLGMGYAWAALDEERLTWHDRISRMYLRRY